MKSFFRAAFLLALTVIGFFMVAGICVYLVTIPYTIANVIGILLFVADACALIWSLDRIFSKL